MDDLVLIMSIMAGVAAGLSFWLGSKIGQVLGHLEAVGAMRWPKSADMAKWKASVNRTMWLCGISELP